MWDCGTHVSHAVRASLVVNMLGRLTSSLVTGVTDASLWDSEHSRRVRLVCERTSMPERFSTMTLYSAWCFSRNMTEYTPGETPAVCR